MKNINLYDQLIELTRIPDAKQKWMGYRKELTRLIIEECHGGTLLVVGAGDCNDIDIEELVSHFESVTLLDRSYVDEDRLKAEYEACEKVTYMSEDLLGIPDVEYRKLCQECQEYIALNMDRFSMAAFADRFISLIEKIYDEARPLRCVKPGMYDNVVCIGVHSQINNMFAWIWDAFETALGQKDSRVHSYIRKMNDSIMAKVNDYLFDIADKKLIIGAEQERIGVEGGVEGAHQCILDVQRRIQSYVYVDVNISVIDWPFDLDRGIVYKMLISSISF